MADIEDSLEMLYDHPGLKTKSLVWKHFGFLKTKEGPANFKNLDMSRAICKLCRRVYANKGNTTNMMAHLNQAHPSDKTGNVSGKKTKVNQTKLTHSSAFVTAAAMSKDRKTILNDALIKLLTGKVLPLSLLDNTLFKDFIKLLDPRYTLPSRNSVVKMISVKKTQMEEKLKRDIIESKGIAVTHDGWTSINTESYGTVTAHFIDKEWRLKSAVLETRKIVGSHTGEAIAENLRRAQKEWSLPSQPTATTDNAANEIKAFEHLQWTRFGCFGHRINLAVKKALSIPELSKMLSKGRKLVTYYHQSSSATDVLKDKQLLLFDSTTTLKLIQDVPTRWNSTLDMLDRLLKLTPAIMAMATDSKSTKTTKEAIKNYSFNFQEQSVLQQIVDVLSPYKKATTILCADTYPTMQKVIPVLLKLDQSTGIHEDDSEVLKKIKNILRDEMKKRSQDRDIPLLASFKSRN